MKRSDATYRVRVRGEWACFTRPELRTERVTYHVMTPSAARGAVEAVLWKPAIRWRVHRIAVLSPIKFASVKRNEVKHVVPVKNARAMMRGEDVADYFADDDRAQRNALVLRDVDYHVDVSFSMTDRAGPGDNPLKFDEMFRRRLERGQYHMAPYLGCREFPAIVESGRDDDPSPIAVDMDLGRMLLDVDYGRPNRPVYFDARMKQGVIEVEPIKRREDGAEVA
ncbi:type I-C CRISPR-associated protein Cas5c [Paludisphaera mucosa]|uniref:pre-crRNA processing endonuclease n=1 Tax=Paludisphaera mucosa TaxID=3030827 RepID=A0ABT6F5H1_9BACT|nr:type I-C CRISPR-associated protein Cas5c [Paludisphaera mucosa]MDG3002827.1 type I-C CRISPR-associated protein Cas5c [Paludisphaera mucosa]